MNMIARAIKHEERETQLLDPRQPEYAKLHELIQRNSLKFGQFTLASGRTSSYLFQLSLTTMSGEALALVTPAILSFMQTRSLRCIGGLESGAVPISAATALAGCTSGYPVSAFFVRKKRKEHGAKQIIEGQLERGADVLVVDDVTTGGGSVIKAIHAVREELGCNVKYALSIVDREQGASEALAAEGVKLFSFFKASDFDLNVS
jgi:orotate phosphoribosyltransferase